VHQEARAQQMDVASTPTGFYDQVAIEKSIMQQVISRLKILGRMNIADIFVMSTNTLNKFLGGTTYTKGIRKDTIKRVLQIYREQKITLRSDFLLL